MPNEPEVVVMNADEPPHEGYHYASGRVRRFTVAVIALPGESPEQTAQRLVKVLNTGAAACTSFDFGAILETEFPIE